jgi:OOP family OmpA-OmpF porin
MKLALRVLFGLTLSFWLAGPAVASHVHERIFEVSPFTGVFLPDSNTGYESASPLVGLRATLNNSAYWALEGMLAWSPHQSQEYEDGLLTSYNAQAAVTTTGAFVGWGVTGTESRVWTRHSVADLLLFGGTMIFHMNNGTWRPFVGVGGGFIDDISNTNDDPPGAFSNGYLDLAAGVKYFRPSGFGFRLDVHDYLMRKDDLPRDDPRAPVRAALADLYSLDGGADGVYGSEPYDPLDHRGLRWLNNIAISVSVTFPFGWVWKDADLDEIADRFDQCPETPPGVIVDEIGCGIDTDEDGVFDGLDQCDDTPLGATVDVVGCPRDTDADGVLDGLDQEPQTPTGALVDARGVSFDTDHDGVLDGLDDCNDTPIGATVDEKGCVTDLFEGRLLRGETVPVDHVGFIGSSKEIEPLSYHYINSVARVIEHWTGDAERPLKIEIGVHTDGVGSDSYNLELSQERADALRLYILSRFPLTGLNNLSAVGYGEEFPLGDDNTQEGREANRRVEVRLVGEGETPEYPVPEEEEAVSEGMEEEGAEELEEGRAPVTPETPLPPEEPFPGEDEFPEFDDE